MQNSADCYRKKLTAIEIYDIMKITAVRNHPAMTKPIGTLSNQN